MKNVMSYKEAVENGKKKEARKFRINKVNEAFTGDVLIASYAEGWVETDINSVHRGELLPKGGYAIFTHNPTVVYKRVVTDPGFWEYEWVDSGKRLDSKTAFNILNAARKEYSRACHKAWMSNCEIIRGWRSVPNMLLKKAV